MIIFHAPTHQQHDPPYEGYTAGGLLPALERAARAEEVARVLRARPWAEVVSPADFGLEPILAIHSAKYLEYLRQAWEEWQVHSPVPGIAFIPGTYGMDYTAARSRRGDEQHGFFLLDTTVAISVGTFDAALGSANCALSGAQALLDGERAAFALCRPPGHHAGREVCGGYCFVNNAAVAAHRLSQEGKTALLDIDYHAGNGTQEIFYARSDVLTVSLHADPAQEYPRYAGYAHETGAGNGLGFHVNLPLPAGTNDAAYLETLEKALGTIRDFGPEYLVISAGMDIYVDDPLGRFEITRQGIQAIGQRLAGLEPSILIVMEGGYHIPSLGENFAALLEPLAHTGSKI